MTTDDELEVKLVHAGMLMDLYRLFQDKQYLTEAWGVLRPLAVEISTGDSDIDPRWKAFADAFLAIMDDPNAKPPTDWPHKPN